MGEQLDASTAKLSQEITDFNQQVADLDKAMAEATTLRQQEKDKNKATIEDANQALAAVDSAVQVLKEFYAKAGQATALLQNSQQPEAPEIFDSPYQGMQGENGGVIGMLEVIRADFARLEAETAADEATSQREYDEFMSESKVNKSQLQTDVEHKSVTVQNNEQALIVKKEDLDG